jgi:hypothetical protein
VAAAVNSSPGIVTGTGEELGRGTLVATVSGGTVAISGTVMAD